MSAQAARMAIARALLSLFGIAGQRCHGNKAECCAMLPSGAREAYVALLPKDVAKMSVKRMSVARSTRARHIICAVNGTVRRYACYASHAAGERRRGSKAIPAQLCAGDSRRARRMCTRHEMLRRYGGEIREMRLCVNAQRGSTLST